MGDSFKSWCVANIPTFILFLTPIMAIACFGDGALSSLEDTTVLVFTIIALVIGVVVSVFMAKYAYQNHDDVVSRRMRYKSSKVELAENRAFYTFWCFVRWIVAWATVEVIVIIILGFD